MSCPRSATCSCLARLTVSPGDCPTPRARSDAFLCLEQCQTDFPSSRAVRPSNDSCRGAVPADGSSSVPQPCWDMAWVEVNGRRHRTRVDGLGRGQTDTLFCGVLGVVEAALGDLVSRVWQSQDHSVLQRRMATTTLSCKPGSCLRIGSQVL